MKQIYIPVSKLLFDTENPRFPLSAKGRPDEEIIKWMLDNANILELMTSIAEKDFFPGEPLLVVKKGLNFEVVEGNRRLTALKLLNDPTLASTKKMSVHMIYNNADFRPDEVPVIEFPHREDIIKYLGYRHITGIEEWGPLEKARYLNLLREPLRSQSVNVQYQILASSIGSKSNYVKRLLAGYDMYRIISEEEAFFNIKGLDETTISFSLITTALNYNNINSFLNINLDSEEPINKINRENLKQFTKWVFEKNTDNKTFLGESRNLRYLNSVVATPKALEKVFEGSNLLDAKLFTNEPSEIFRKSLRDSFQNIGYAKENFTWVDEITNYDIELIDNIGKIAKELKILAENKTNTID
jgi:hypothetical protein